MLLLISATASVFCGHSHTAKLEEMEKDSRSHHAPPGTCRTSLSSFRQGLCWLSGRRKKKHESFTAPSNKLMQRGFDSATKSKKANHFFLLPSNSHVRQVQIAVHRRLVRQYILLEKYTSVPNDLCHNTQYRSLLRLCRMLRMEEIVKDLGCEKIKMIKSSQHPKQENQHNVLKK